VAEGAYNVVARYQGPHAALQGLVLRCAKRGVRPHDPPVAHAAAAAFAHVVMMPLLGRRYVLPAGGGVAIRPRVGFVNSLDAHMWPARPAERAHQPLDDSLPGVWLMLNTSVLPSDAAEVRGAPTRHE
jgi:hypothetical protein